MADHFKYTTKNSEDIQWGLFINVSGSATINSKTNYPPEGHPSAYQLNWKKGRILREYQLNYITKGGGIIETIDGTFRIPEGSIILLYPGVWHRYRPLKMGWSEHYVGFDGDFADRIFGNDFFLGRHPIIHVGFREELHTLFHEIQLQVQLEKSGYQQICAGMVHTILGIVMSIKKNEDFEGKEIEKKIRKACIIIRDHMDRNLIMETLASDLNTGYSNFRQMFKKYTGLSPVQYHISLKIQHAKELLCNTDMSIKEISYKLEFSSIHYFSRIFKSKTRNTPSEYRNLLKLNTQSENPG
jgi:AraC-like DNA-binding protein